MNLFAYTALLPKIQHQPWMLFTLEVATIESEQLITQLLHQLWTNTYFLCTTTEIQQGSSAFP